MLVLNENQGLLVAFLCVADGDAVAVLGLARIRTGLDLELGALPVGKVLSEDVVPHIADHVLWRVCV